MEHAYKDVSELIEYPAADIRKAAVSGVGQFLVCVANVAKENKTADALTGLSMIHFVGNCFMSCCKNHLNVFILG